MGVIGHLIGKEARLLLRDMNALALLFLMPAIFILIMSLALQSRFDAQNGVALDYYLVNQDSGEMTARLVERLAAMESLHAIDGKAPPDDSRGQLGRHGVKFLLRIPPDFGAHMLDEEPLPLEISVAPDVEATVARLFSASVHDAIGQVIVAQLAAAAGGAEDELDFGAIDRLVVQHSTWQGSGDEVFPSSVQQNVPAWLLFAMFFIAIPLSTTWVAERAQGTYTRLRAMGVGSVAMLVGKLSPYVVVNLVQVVLMLAVGVYVVPLFGGGQLDLGHSRLALALVSLAASFAAVSYALLVANIVTSSEQATIFTGVANLLMAALGGIMVPRFVMPEAMQAISHHSPMAWGLDGFLDVFLRGGGTGMVLDSVIKLLLFGLACLVVAAGWMRWKQVR